MIDVFMRFLSILCPKHLCIISIAFLQIFIFLIQFLYSVFIFFFEFWFFFFVVVQINSNEKNGILIIFILFCLFCWFVDLYFIRIMTIKFENRIKDSKRQEPHVDLQEGRKQKQKVFYIYLYFFYIFLNSVQQLSVDFYLSLILFFYILCIIFFLILFSFPRYSLQFYFLSLIRSGHF